MNPQPSWDELAAYYSAEYSPYDPNHGASQGDSEVLVEAKRVGNFRHIAVLPGLRLLDVGCGGGYFLRIMNQLGFQTMGVEPSESGAEVARRDGLNIFHGTLEEFQHKEGVGKFDVITSSHVLEHVPDPIETLKAMRQLLTSTGYVWIAVPNAGCVWSQHLGTRWHSRDVPYHLQQFTSESMKKAAQNSGFKVRSLETYSMPSAVAASIRQYLRLRFLLSTRLSGRLGLIDSMIAPRVARRLDSKIAGEAILTTLVDGASH